MRAICVLRKRFSFPLRRHCMPRSLSSASSEQIFDAITADSVCTSNTTVLSSEFTSLERSAEFLWWTSDFIRDTRPDPTWSGSNDLKPQTAERIRHSR